MVVGIESIQNLVGGFKYFFIFTPKIGEDFQFDDHIFQMGWFNHQPENEFIQDTTVDPLRRFKESKHFHRKEMEAAGCQVVSG